MPSVLVTGSGRGIGRATAQRLAAAGWDVYAGVRKPADAPSGERLTAVQLDITSPADLDGLDAALPAQLDAVVNNAGIVVGAPVETVPLDELRNQLEVNVTGQVAVTQAVLPRLRASKGRIVFVSSVSGRVATPMTGPYNASKFALEGLADSLRMELKPWGIGVILVEPAQTATDMWGTADDVLAETVAGMSPEHRSLYAKHTAGMKRVIKVSQKMAVPPENVAATIEKALTASRPRARYVVGAGPKVQAALSKVTPTPVLDAALRAATGVPRKA
jgi:NAD(P)-dependent dehydrogenase (short-subunit alcohol dehydrogenase family)